MRMGSDAAAGRCAGPGLTWVRDEFARLPTADCAGSAVRSRGPRRLRGAGWLAWARPRAIAAQAEGESNTAPAAMVRDEKPRTLGQHRPIARATLGPRAAGRGTRRARPRSMRWRQRRTSSRRPGGWCDWGAAHALGTTPQLEAPHRLARCGGEETRSRGRYDEDELERISLGRVASLLEGSDDVDVAVGVECFGEGVGVCAVVRGSG